MTMQSVKERGVMPAGEQHYRAKLRDHEVNLVLELKDQGLSLQCIAAKFEVTKSCVSHIVAGRRRV